MPYVGSTTQIKQLKTGDTFEDGKVYLATLLLRNQDDFRFGDGFTVTFRQKNESASNYALLKCVSDTAKRKEYNVWYTVGDVTPQPVTELAITGPALQPDGSLATDDLTAFFCGRQRDHKCFLLSKHREPKSPACGVVGPLF